MKKNDIHSVPKPTKVTGDVHASVMGGQVSKQGSHDQFEYDGTPGSFHRPNETVPMVDVVPSEKDWSGVPGKAKK